MSDSKIQIRLNHIQQRMNKLNDEASILIESLMHRQHEFAIPQKIPISYFDDLKSFLERNRKEKRELSIEVRSLAKQIDEVESRSRYYKKLYETGFSISSEVDIQKLLDMGMESAIEITGAKRGYLALLNSEGELTFIIAKNIDEQEVREQKYEISQNIIQEVLKTRAPVEICDALEDSKYKMFQSVEGFQLRSILCIPLESNGEIFGVIYIDNKDKRGIFDKDTIALLKAFAQQISVGVKRALDYKIIRNSNEIMMEHLRAQYDFTNIIGRSPKLVETLEIVSKVANSQANILIQGESGTGKELIARAIHYNSARRENPFVTVNVSAIPDNLLESELFGYDKGAFTGATISKPGKFELAEAGTIFLDEIGEMNTGLQSKILRVIQSREIDRLGSIKPRHVNVRIVAATNKELKKSVEMGLFREDLYYRLNVVGIQLPPLRERIEDVELLVNNFIQHYSKRERKIIQSISNNAISLLKNYNYPGNIRELENIIERAVILCNDSEVDIQHLPREIVGSEPIELKEQNSFNDAVNEFKKNFLLRILDEAGNNKAEAARRLGVNRTYLFKLFEQLNIK